MPAKPTDPKPVRFRQVFKEGERLYALDLNGQLWACATSSNGHDFPVNKLQWLKCAMPVEEQ